MEKVQVWGIVEVVLGALVIAAFVYPSMWSNIVLGVLVLVFGALTILHGRPKAAPAKEGAKTA
jgi:uncharacterized membrane protein HdeD (DUF308 family)